MSVDISHKQGNVKRSEVESLASLLEDPDTYVHKEALKRLFELGEKAIPLLDEYCCGSRDTLIQRRIQNIIRQISLCSLEQDFIRYLENGVETLSDLENGVFILSRFENPTIRTEVYQHQLDEIAENIAPLISGLTTAEACKATLHHIFETERFRPASKEYFDPANSYFHQVLQRREGIPISLAMVGLFVSRRLDLPFEGVNMPMHFLLRYQTGKGNGYVYVDPFNKGEEVRVEQCAFFLKKCGIRPSKHHFTAAPPAEMLARMLRNFINSYEKRHEHHRVKDFKKLLELLETSQSGWNF